MGAYLSQPKTDKVSTDEMNDLLVVGASSMQGWRNSQEDAHNSILNYDVNTSFFAVYDGHGGAEVATYCADKLPQFLKDLDYYKRGEIEKALQAAFLGFDKTLLEPEVVEILKVLAGEKNFAEADDSDLLEDDEDDEDLAELREEGNLPLNEVLEKYKGGPSMPALKKIKDSEPRASGSKPQSPFLRGRRAAAVAADAANKAEINEKSIDKTARQAEITKDKETKRDSLDHTVETDVLEDDSTVSSSSSGARKNNNINNSSAASSISSGAAEAEASEPQENIRNGSIAVASSNLSITPDSSHSKESEQNGSVTSSIAKATKIPNVSSCASTKTSASENNKSSEDATVSGSNDAGGDIINGISDIEATSSSVKAPPTTDRSGISSTSKDVAKEKSNMDDDSTDEDADFDADETSSNDEAEALQPIEYSSDDELADEEDDGEEEDGDEEAEEEEEDDEEDEEGVLANEQFCANMIEEPGKDSGCTAVVALLCGRDLYVANAGDSRCVVCRNGKAIEMSLDHKPEDDEESARILKAGGRVTLDGRVNGGLNLSRAIGDHAYKMNSELQAEDQMISALPDIKKLIITPDDEFMVLACDGIWNYMSSEEVVDFVRLRLKDESKKTSRICEELFDNCLAPNTMGDGTGCDNMTAVIVRFRPKLLDLATKINPDETEDVVLAKKAAESDAADVSLQKSLKRSPPSPSCEDNYNEAEKANKSKRMKTDNKDESSTSCTNYATSSTTSNCNNTNSDSTSAITARASVCSPVENEQAECDSVNISMEEAAAAANLSST